MSRIATARRQLPPQLAAVLDQQQKPTKFRSRTRQDDMGVVYESQLERQVMFELTQLQARLEIARWSWGPRFVLSQDPARPNTLVTYRPDFVVWPHVASDDWYVIDAKGVRTATFNLKARLWKLRYPDHQLMLVTKEGEWKPT